MTLDEVQDALDEISRRHLYSQIRPSTEDEIRVDVVALVHRIYAEGGAVRDHLGVPIEHLDDVSVAITVDPIGKRVSVTTVRRAAPPPDEAEPEGDDTGPLHFRRSPLIPMTWAVRCPGCEELIDVVEMDVSEAAEGVYEADASIGAPWIRCDDCGTLIEIVGVKIDQKIPTPGVGWR